MEQYFNTAAATKTNFHGCYFSDEKTKQLITSYTLLFSNTLMPTMQTTTVFFF